MFVSTDFGAVAIAVEEGCGWHIGCGFAEETSLSGAFLATSLGKSFVGTVNRTFARAVVKVAEALDVVEQKFERFEKIARRRLQIGIVVSNSVVHGRKWHSPAVNMMALTAG